MAAENRLKLLKLVVMGIVVSLIQFSFVRFIEIDVWRPDLVLLLTLYIGYCHKAAYGTVAGFILGVIQDSLSASTVGLSALANSIVGFLAGQVQQFKLSFNAKILTTIILILVHGLIFFMLYQFKTEITYVSLILTRVFPNTIYTFLIGLVLSVFVRTELEKI